MKKATYKKVDDHVMKDIDNLKNIIFAIKQSIPYAQNEEERKIYIDSIGRYENDLKELQLCVMQ